MTVHPILLPSVPAFVSFVMQPGKCQLEVRSLEWTQRYRSRTVSRKAHYRYPTVLSLVYLRARVTDNGRSLFEYILLGTTILEGAWNIKHAHCITRVPHARDAERIYLLDATFALRLYELNRHT